MSRITAVLLLAPWLALGCDATHFVPPRNAELEGGVSRTERREPGGLPGSPAGTQQRSIPPQARTLELILSHPQTGDRQHIEQVIRRELGHARASLRLLKPEGSEDLTPDRIAAGIRSAIARGSRLLVMEPKDTPEIRAALLDAESRGMAILLLDQTLPAHETGKSLPLLAVTGFPERGRDLVRAAFESAPRLGLPPDASALVLQNRQTDVYSKERQESLRDALKSAGRTFRMLEFEGDRKKAYSVLREAMKADPRARVILTEEDHGLGGAVDLHRDRPKLHLPAFALAGYASYDLRIDREVAQRCAGFVERGLGNYAITIAELAQAVFDGKPLPERTGIEMRFLRP
jgi:ABC-type sugar transport system substrate-binding protein